ncbi:MAG: tRNA uridine-5-carboxymethylaminomethyl(34) synthesis GTPase MnmE [Spirochaetales bacterium]|nr:tRNA uridine-5-carboxymethylaminomethyl(34) synthesis GTPase MnmE [Spirochaetales bacterium]
MKKKLELLDDTICAICTPSGVGSVSVIRITGPASKKIATDLFRLQSGNAPLEHRRTYVGNIVYRERVVDECMCVFFESPNSLTGQDVVEFHTHGGSIVPNMVLKSILDHGEARVAEPGEFTYRSFINGKIDLLKAEAISSLINSQSEAAAACSTNNISGAVTKKFNNLSKLGLNLLAEVEARIDFPEEELPEFNTKMILKEFDSLIRESGSLLRTYDLGKLVVDGLRVLILGEPNVGKSTLLNSLIEEEKAIVADTPGTTRDIVDSEVFVNGTKIIFSDTAGIRVTTDEVENIGIGRAKDKILYSDLVLIVIDKNIDFSSADKLFNFVPREKTLYILNKSDLYPPDKKWKLEKQLDKENIDYIRVSAKDRTNIGLLTDKLLGFGKINDFLGSTEALLTTERQVEHLKEGISNLKKALVLFNESAPMEIVSIEIREFLNNIGKITGDISNEDVYDALFSKFCIGK